jgi:hypothetical protein
MKSIKEQAEENSEQEYCYPKKNLVLKFLYFKKNKIFSVILDRL